MTRIHKPLFSRFLAAALSLAMTAPGIVHADIIFATEGDYPPWNETNESGGFAGFEIDLVNAICQTIGTECGFVAAPFPEMMDRVAAGEFDAIISGIAITAERAEKIAFTRPYMSWSVSFAVAARAPLAADPPASVEAALAALASLRIGAQKGTVNAMLISEFLPDATLVTFDSQEGLNRALAAGDIDAGLAATQTWRNPSPIDPGALVAIGPPLTSTAYPVLGRGLGIGLARDNAALKASLDEAICALAADGSIANFSRTWFSADLSVRCE